jgi:membrane fusion protein, multidrug efflux system
VRFRRSVVSVSRRCSAARWELLELVRRHFFLFGALAVLAVVIVLGLGRILFPPATANGAGGAPGAAAASGGGGGAGRRPGGPGGPGGGAAVTPTTAAVRTFTDRIEVIGVARGRQSVTITSSTTELVTRVRFRDGQSVPRGAVLVDLQASEEDANIITARAAEEQARRQYLRWKTLADKGIVSPAAMEQYKATHEQARANLLAAQSRRSDRAIRAPFSGVVGISDIAPGALINPGAEVATLDDISTIRVDFEIPDRYLPVVRQGQAIVARPDALADRSFPGRIATLDTRIDERTRAIRARAEFANPTGELRPGMMMRVGINQSSRQAVSVPEAAVQYLGESANVFVIAKGPNGAVAEQRPVTLGLTEQGFVEIRTGLRAGEQVIADGISRIQPGQPVRVAGQGGGAAAAGKATAAPAGGARTAAR